MAEKPIKSIKFPGLPDTYTFPIIDNSLTVEGAAADAKVVGDALATKATEAFVTNKIAEAQLSGGGSGDIDLSGYATKDDLATKQPVGDYATKDELNAIDYPVDSVNGKTGDVTLSASDIGARPDTWMPTAAEVGAMPSVGGVFGKSEVYYRSPGSDGQISFHQNYVTDGSGIWLYGNNFPNTDVAGRFRLQVYEPSTGRYRALDGCPNGDLIWGGNHVLHTGNKNLITPADIGAVDKNGDTMTGNLTVPGFTVFAGHNWPTVVLTNNANLLPRIELSSNFENKQFYFINRHDPTNENNYEVFDLPNATTSGSNWYSILTTKAPVAVHQGGTGATDAATARANLGAAPAGFGLGEAPGNVPYLSDLSTATKSGWYGYRANAVGNPMPGWNGTLLVTSSYEITVQTAYCAALNRVVATRCLDRCAGSTTFSEWEWINPKMDIGVEYRTTERFNGKAVYTKLFSFGALPNATYSAKAHGISGITHTISCHGCAKTNGGSMVAIPIQNTYGTLNNGSIQVKFDHTQVVIATSADVSDHTEVLLVLKYTK